ncbi:MAG: hypothetical protein QGI86_25270 [Candidatus Poribacteria bacterium]|nr:hypothetical protein [Candidatus Poribacteria bacterium]MDP6748067.1 hypothetical protein [Candidatus Poribacteria bacterium]MDP6999466.1 hypothetical protein [Candidatus Poribacteria bacterium]
MDRIEALNSANLTLDSLACQPWVFSPKGNAFNTHHYPFFHLEPTSLSLHRGLWRRGGQLIEWMTSTTDIQLGEPGHSLVELRERRGR